MTDIVQRNIGILAHIDAGKTTLTENLLHLAGELRYPGAVEHGTTVTDWQLQEQERGITIGAAAVSFPWRDARITVVDTPGHVDFTIEVARALRALDGAILVLSGPDGVQAQTETVWMQATEHRIPAIAFINKLDRPGYDEDAIYAQIRDRLGITPAPLGRARLDGSALRVHDFLTDTVEVWELAGLTRNQRAPMRTELPDEDERLHREVGLDELADAIAAFDDGFAELILEGQQPPLALWVSTLRKATVARACLPIFHGVARFGVGVEAVADAVLRYLPGPADVGLPAMVDGLGGDTVAHDVSVPIGPLAFVFKTERRRKGQELAFVRTYAGTLRVGDTLLARRADRPCGIAALYTLFAGDAEPVDALGPGEIGAVELLPGEPALRTGDTLAGAPQGPVFEGLAVPHAVIAVAIEAEDAEGHDRLEGAARELIAHDPSLILGREPETGLLTIAGMGELHLDLAAERLEREWDLVIRVGSPRVHHKDQLLDRGRGGFVATHERYGSGQVSVEVVVEPRAELATPLPAYAAPAPRRADWRAALDAGVHAACVGGRPGYDLTGVGVTITSIGIRGSDLTPLAFRDAGFHAAIAAIQAAGAIEVEPWCQIRVIVPEEMVGRIVGDLARRRAKIGTTEAVGVTQLLHASGPLSEFIGYATSLRSMTAGRGVFSLELNGWEPVETQ